MPECWRRAIAKCALATTGTLEEWEAGAEPAELEALEAANESYWQALSPLAPSDMDYSFVSAKEEQEKEEDEEQEYNPGGQERVEVWLQGVLLKDQFEESEDEDEDEGYESEIELGLLPPLEAIPRTWLQSPLAKFTEAQLAKMRTTK
jgi:hypothetical protein